MKKIVICTILLVFVGISSAQSSTEYYEARERAKTEVKLDIKNEGMVTGISAGGCGALLLAPIFGGSMGVIGSYIWSNGKDVEVPFIRLKQLEEENRSPDYTRIYNTTYQEEGKKIMNKNALTGSIGGCLLAFALNVVIMMN